MRCGPPERNHPRRVVTAPRRVVRLCPLQWVRHDHRRRLPWNRPGHQPVRHLRGLRRGRPGPAARRSGPCPLRRPGWAGHVGGRGVRGLGCAGGRVRAHRPSRLVRRLAVGDRRARLACGIAATMVLSAALEGSALRSWGWRLAFLLALPLGLIGLYRRGEQISPVAGGAGPPGRLRGCGADRCIPAGLHRGHRHGSVVIWAWPLPRWRRGLTGLAGTQRYGAGTRGGR